MGNVEHCIAFHHSVIGLIILGLTTTPSVLGDDVTVVSLNRDVPAKRLTCWTCRHLRSSRNPNCISMGNKTEISQVICHLTEPFCRVRKLMKDDHVEQLERSCAQSCDPVCEKINKVQTCTSCCAHQLCNTGNGADVVMPQFLTLAASLFLTLIFRDLIRHQYIDFLARLF